MSAMQSLDELEIFERVLDKQVVILDDLRLDIKVSVASLEDVEALGLDLMSMESEEDHDAPPVVDARAG